MISIELESENHRDAIRQLTVDAFAASEFGHNGEADLVDSIRAASEEVLSLVAIKDSMVVGHILLSPAMIVLGEHQLVGMGLAPMSVLPAFQRTGIGSQLVKEALLRVSERNVGFTIVAGHSDFYPRFGFEPASKYGITHGFAGMPQELFFIHTDDASQLRNFQCGLAYYDPVFGTQHEPDAAADETDSDNETDTNHP